MWNHRSDKAGGGGLGFFSVGYPYMNDVGISETFPLYSEDQKSLFRLQFRPSPHSNLTIMPDFASLCLKEKIYTRKMTPTSIGEALDSQYQSAEVGFFWIFLAEKIRQKPTLNWPERRKLGPGTFQRWPLEVNLRRLVAVWWFDDDHYNVCLIKIYM